MGDNQQAVVFIPPGGLIHDIPTALRQEFEYIRHGTTTVIGNWDAVAGAVFQNTIGPTRSEEDFVAHVDQTVASDPEAKWVFVPDRLEFHCSAGLTAWVAERREPERPLGKTRRARRAEGPGNASRIPV